MQLIQPPDDVLRVIFSPEVFARLDSARNPSESLSFRLRVLRAHGPYPCDPWAASELRFLRAWKAAWSTYLYTAFACGMFEGDQGRDLRARLTGVGDADFRSAMSECLTCWFLAGRLKLTVNPRALGRKGKKLEMLIEFGDGDVGVEVKAPLRERPVSGVWHGDDADKIVGALRAAERQFDKSRRNILVVVPSLGRELFSHREPLVRASYGETKITWQMNTETGEGGPTKIKFFPEGTLEHMKQEVRHAIDGLAVDRSLRISSSTRKRLAKATTDAIDRSAPVDSLAGEPVHNLSESQVQQQLTLLSAAETASANRVRALAVQLEKAYRGLQEAEKGLALVPEDRVVRPFAEELAELSKRLGALENERRRLEDETSSTDNVKSSLLREREHLLAAQASREGLAGRQSLIARSRAALSAYSERLTRLKITELESSVADCFSRLSRKGDLVHRMEVDSVTYSVTLYDSQGRVLPKEKLSSGEKQIYAISLLWGLAKTSGRPLPVIVDTPLGRLDSDHRRNLVENYFPHASHQVILLSTDTEIDRPLFNELKPSISHSYHLVYDPQDGRTNPVQEYFWKG